MQRIERDVKKGKEVVGTRTSRGPFLTDSTIFDAGNREIVVELWPRHMALRQKGRRRGVVLMTYDRIMAYGWKIQMEERVKLKRAEKKARAGK